MRTRIGLITSKFGIARKQWSDGLYAKYSPLKFYAMTTDKQPDIYYTCYMRQRIISKVDVTELSSTFHSPTYSYRSPIGVRVFRVFRSDSYQIPIGMGEAVSQS